MSLFLISFQSYGQVNGVKYQLKFNIDSCRYDAFLIIDSGSSQSLQDRIQDYSQYSIVVPAGTNIWVIQNYFPLLENDLYGGTEPVSWNVNSVINAPEIMPESDFYIFSPSLDETSTYNDLNPGDTIRLFSLYIDNITNCGQQIRIFQNGIDPGPLDPGMGFLDCSNNFSLVGSPNVYLTNESQVNPPPPVFSDFPSVSCNLGVEIDITINSSDCELPISYDWQGPNNFMSTSEDILITPTLASNTGDYKIVLSNNFGCKDSLIIYAENKPLAGDDQLICPGSTINLSGSNPSSGNWTQHQNNLPGANITMIGGGQAEVHFEIDISGIYAFIYSSNTCSDTMFVTVNSTPITSSSNGGTILCIGETLILSPTEGGTWTSSDTLIATINFEGIISTLMEGSVSFTYTDLASGCSSSALTLTILPIPIITLDGTPEVCVGSTTILIPSSIGFWSGWDPSILSVNDTGLVEGISTGTTSLFFTDSLSGCTAEAYYMVVDDVPITNISGPDIICIDGFTQLSPSSGGVWTSNNPTIATVDSSGLVLGLDTGQCLFTWTQTSTGCASVTSSFITINNSPTVYLDLSEICIGSIVNLMPNTGGTWISNSTSIASVGFSSGIVSGLSQGDVTFTFTNSLEGCTATTDTLIVLPEPELSIDMSNICIGSLTMLHPSSGGTWTSLDNEIAFIFGNLVVGTGAGFVQILYTDDLTGCDNTIQLSVTERATINIIGDNEICVGLTTELSPSNGGTWFSSNTSVATITDEGIVTAISEGDATFTFTEMSTGCNSLPSDTVIVNPNPIAFINGLDSICIGESSILEPSLGGIWISNNPDIAEIEPISGIVTAVSSGVSTFVFTSDAGCSSPPTSPIFVLGSASINLPVIQDACLGEELSFTSSSGGIWTSLNSSVAEITEDGHVTTLSVGWTLFTFTDTTNRCLYTTTSDTLKVISCFKPDFNLTKMLTNTSGDLSTNDINSVTVNYGPDFNLMSSPPSSNYTLNLSLNGTYSFSADSSGVYVFEIFICVPPNTEDCTSTILTVTVVDHTTAAKTVTSNIDFATTFMNSPITILTLRNDACIAVGGCALDTTAITIINPPNSGSAILNTLTGNINYIPNNSFFGLDTIHYEVCILNEPSNCSSSHQIINVVPNKSINSTIANDDLFIGSYGQIIIGNLINNDIDPENDLQIVTPNTVSDFSGTFILDSLGNFSFEPLPGFTGPTNFVYQICDTNIDVICVKATLYILVMPNLELNLRVYLEGSLLENGNAETNGRPLMRDNLRVSPFTGSRYIPVQDPYQSENTYFDIRNKYNHIGCGTNPVFQNISLPEIVFGVSGQDAIVDWVFIELRSKNDNKIVIATRSGLVQRDGDIVDLDGASSLQFPGVSLDNYYIVIRHRNHLGVMSLQPLSYTQLQTLVDFTSPSFPTFDFGTTKNNGYDYTGLAQNQYVINGYNAMWAGDFDANSKIKASNPNDDINNLFFEIFIYPENTIGNSNFDQAYGYFQGDYDMNSKSKYDNPNDDKNFIYAQLLFYPQNTQLLPNFDFFIGQIP